MKNSNAMIKTAKAILDLHVGHVGGGVQKNILSIPLWTSAVVGELHCLVTPERLVASQKLKNNNMNAGFIVVFEFL